MILYLIKDSVGNGEKCCLIVAFVDFRDSTDFNHSANQHFSQFMER